MTKKRLHILIAMLMIVLLLAACGSSKSDSGGDFDTDPQTQLSEVGIDVDDDIVEDELVELTEELESELEDLEAIGDLIDEDGNVKASVTEDEKREIEEALGVSLSDVGKKGNVRGVLKERKEEVQKKKAKVASDKGTSGKSTKGTTTNKGGSKSTKSIGKGTSTSSNSSTGGNKSKSTGSSSSSKSNKGTTGNNSSSSSNSSTTGSGTTSTPAKPEPKVEWKTETTSTETIKYKTDKRNDSSLEKGKTSTEREGKNGKKVTKCEVEYVDGKKTGKTRKCDTTTTAAVNKVVLVGTKEPAPSFDRAAMENQVFNLINTERGDRPKYTLNTGLAASARNHSNHIMETRPSNKHSGPYTRGAKEIVASGGTASANGALTAWRSSAQHMGAIMSVRFTQMGVGVSDDGSVVTVHFE